MTPQINNITETRTGFIVEWFDTDVEDAPHHSIHIKEGSLWETIKEEGLNRLWTAPDDYETLDVAYWLQFDDNLETAIKTHLRKVYEKQ